MKCGNSTLCLGTATTTSKMLMTITGHKIAVHATGANYTLFNVQNGYIRHKQMTLNLHQYYTSDLPHL